MHKNVIQNMLPYKNNCNKYFIRKGPLLILKFCISKRYHIAEKLFLIKTDSYMGVCASIVHRKASRAFKYHDKDY